MARFSSLSAILTGPVCLCWSVNMEPCGTEQYAFWRRLVDDALQENTNGRLWHSATLTLTGDVRLEEMVVYQITHDNLPRYFHQTIEGANGRGNRRSSLR
jgi:hypothetical protein